MHSFVNEIGARIVAFVLCLYLFRNVRKGLVERKIRILNADFLDWYSYGYVQRDTAPIRYWLEIGVRIMGFVPGIATVIFGWLPPTA
jgi:hypothetical protein